MNIINITKLYLKPIILKKSLTLRYHYGKKIQLNIETKAKYFDNYRH